MLFFVFKQETAYEMRISDLSSDVCSSDLGVDDAEGLEEGVDDVDDDEEEGRRREQREDDGPEAAQRPRAVDRRRLDERARDRLQTGQDKQEVVADLLPGCGDHHQEHRLTARSEEHTSELQSLMRSSYAVFCLKKKNR